ncbi:MAG: hypothetical protein QOJ64_3366 [Acidobacteriota bacterium]|jgi:hypothetical protein|nr:hypothetical protein [Acidobacteriota bacterium]
MPSNIRLIVIALLLFATPLAAGAQSPPAKPAANDVPQKNDKDGKKAAATRERPDPLAAERRAAVVTLATALAEEARGYRDEQLRARVLMRTADALWVTNAEQARSLFRRAWDTAESADKEAFRIEGESRRAQPVSGSGVERSFPNLRGEILRLAARRDRALGEEFLRKLTDATEQEKQSLPIATDNSPVPSSSDPEDPPPVIAQRLKLAREFLNEGDTERALQFAEGALAIVSTKGINFLSALREKDQAASDKLFAAMMQYAAADPASDAVTVSVLSSYAFTPFLTVVVRGDGRNHSSQERDRITAPNISPQLRTAFLRVAAQILLRPMPTKDQDRTLAGRGGLYFTIARLLPLFEQYAPDFSPELRAQLSALAPDAAERFRSGTDRMLTRGLVPEEQMRDEKQEALESAERAADPAERDASYARAALGAARRGELTARDLADKISDSELRKGARAFIDFMLVSRALDQKDAPETLRRIHTGELTNIQKAWALSEVSRLMTKTDAKNAAEVLDEAATEARRIGTGDPNRARALFGVATRMFELDRNRAWEIVAEAVKAANSASEFTGEDAQLVARFANGRGATTTNFDVESFDLNGIFGLLAKDDLYRAVEQAKGFTGEAPRATATLAIVRAILEQKRRETRTESQVVTN